MGKIKHLSKRFLAFLRNTSRKQRLTALGISIILLSGMVLASFILTRDTMANWWPGDGTGSWLLRKQLTVTNNSAGNLSSGTTVAITINSKELYETGKLKNDCSDLRVLYQPNTTTANELVRHLVFPAGTTCATSEATKVYFQLQSALNSDAGSTDYYLYYQNPQATTPTNTDSAFNVGSKQALLVCPFDGTTDCAAGETPSTETGTIRYSGAKSALSFDGNNDFINHGDLSTMMDGTRFTYEAWVYPTTFRVNYPRIISKTTGTHTVQLRLLANNGRAEFYANFVTAGMIFISDTNPLTLNSWSHLAVAYDGKTLRLFVNGHQVTSTNLANDALYYYANNVTSTFIVGAANEQGNSPFEGYIDEVKISDIARYTSNFNPQTTPFVRDEHTKLLLHFDESGGDPRNTGKAIDDSGNNYHGTINGNPTYVTGLVGVDSSTSDTGSTPRQTYASHEGIFVEEGTTNKITNPSFEHSTYNTSWTASGGTVTENTTAPFYKFGSKSYKIVLSDATDQTVTASIDAGNTNTHTLSAYVYRGTSENVGGTVDATVAQLVFNGTAQTTTYTDMGGGWWRLSYTAAAGSGAQSYGVQVNEDSGTLYIDGVQLEQRAYATTYADGSLGDNYSWSGTTHESTSSRTVGNLVYPNTDNISSTAGSISVWVKTNINPTSALANTVKDIIRASNQTNGYVLEYNGYPATGFRFTKHVSGTGYATYQSVTLASDTWYHLVATWDTTNGTRLYMNAGTPGTNSNTSDPGTTTNIAVGLATQGGLFVTSDFRIFDSALTATEVSDLYLSGLVSHQQGLEVEAFSQEKGQNPVAIWKFDEGYGTTAHDSSTYGNHLTVSGASWNTQSMGARNQRVRNLSFDGIDNYAYRETERSFNFGTGGFTITGWFRHPSTAPPSGTHTILSRYSTAGYKVYMNTSGQICFGIDDDSTWGPDDEVCTTTSYADSRWYQFAAVKEGTSAIRIYVNSTEIASNTSLTAIGSLNSSAPLYIGIDSDGVSNPWGGWLDQIVIYPYARTADQIKADYLGNQVSVLYGSSPQDFLTEGLVGYWKMDEESWDGTTGEVIDSSGNENHGVSATNDSGTSSGSNTSTTLNDTSKSWTTNVFANHNVAITGGTGSGQTRTISSNTATELTVSSAWDTTPDATSTYRITGTTTAGKFGNAGNFDEVDYYVSIPDTPELRFGSDNQDFSIFAWVKRIGISSSIILSKFTSSNNRYQLRFTVGNQLRFEMNNNITIQSSSTFTSTADWYHVGVVINRKGYGQIYVNGIPNGNPVAIGGEVMNPTASLMLGAQAGVASLNGLLDEVRFYNRTLSPAEVQQLYNWAPGPVGYWKFDEGTGTNAYDSSGNVNHGTLTNSGWVNGKFGKALETRNDSTIDNATITNPASGVLDFSDTDNFTLSAWVKSSSINGSPRIISKGGETVSLAGYQLFLDSAGNKYVCRYIDGDGTGSDLVDIISVGIANDGLWHHVACVMDRDGTATGTPGLHGFLDGVLKASDTSLTESSAENNNDLIIGEIHTANQMNGGIDEVKIYNYARTPAQIIEDMNAGHPAPGSPVGSALIHYKLDEGYGTAANNSGSAGSSLDGVITGATWTNDGKFGKALSFDGSGDYIQRSDTSAIDFSSTFTLSGWFYPQTSNASKALIVKDTAYRLVTNASGQPLCQIYASAAWQTAATSTTAIPTNTWSHVLCTYDKTEGQIRVYVNGIQTGSQAQTNTINNSSANLRVGSDTSTTYGDFEGMADEIKLYNFALTASQVPIEMNQGMAQVWGATSTDSTGAASWSATDEYCPPGQTTACLGPVGHWKFDENTGTNAFDSSGNNNTGTLNNVPTWVSGKTGSALNFIKANHTYVRAPNTTTIENVFDGGGTFSFWVYPTANTGQILNKEAGWRVFVFGESANHLRLRFVYYFSTTTGAFTQTNYDIPLNQWTHFALAYNNESTANRPKMYVNGKEVPITTAGPDGTRISDAADSLTIGHNKWANDTTNAFSGFIDEVKIYDYIRTPAQIAWDYNRGGPVGWWKFDECTGETANDASGNGNNGTITIGASGTQTSAGTCTSGNTAHAWHNGRDGKFNASLNFDGTDDMVTIPVQDMFSFTDGTRDLPFTFAAWIKTTGSGYGYIISKSNLFTNNREYHFILDVDAYLELHLRNGGRIVRKYTTALETNVWHHVVGTYDGSETSEGIRLYVNGKRVDNLTNDAGSYSGMANTSADLMIGHEIGPSGDPARVFNGQIDDVRIYNYVLTEEQIRTVYTGGAMKFGN